MAVFQIFSSVGFRDLGCAACGCPFRNVQGFGGAPPRWLSATPAPPPAEFGVAAEIATAIRAITWWMVSEQWQRHHSCVVPLCAVSIRWRLC